MLDQLPSHYFQCKIWLLCACRWDIDPAVEATIAAKRTTWIDSPPELPSQMMVSNQESHTSRKSMPSWSKHATHDEEKHDSSVERGQN